LADEIRDELHLNVALKKSSGGRFEVYSGKKTIFSKAELSRFPKKGEIISTLKKETEA